MACSSLRSAPSTVSTSRRLRGMRLPRRSSSRMSTSSTSAACPRMRLGSSASAIAPLRASLYVATLGVAEPSTSLAPVAAASRRATQPAS